MLQKIFRQLWNQRRQNGWIFMELLVAGFFLWTVLDPVCVLIANLRIDCGYRPRGVYVVQLGTYDPGSVYYRQEADNDSLRKEDYLRIVRTLRRLPELASYSLSSAWSFPNCGSWNGAQLYADTVSMGKENGYVHVQYYDFVATEGSHLFRTYGMTDALTGGEVKLPADVQGKAFISERLAERLFGTTDVVGRKLYIGKNSDLQVAGVLRNYKHRDYEQPYPLIVRMNTDVEASPYIGWQYNVILRLKEGVEAEDFEQRFRKEVAPLLSVGNFYFVDLNTFTELSDMFAAGSGVTNKLRLQYILTGFALLCTFLGMVGTFWIRCNARRMEIGIMRSMGASINKVCRQFLLEAWLLVTLAFIVVWPLLLGHACMNGLYCVEIDKKHFVPDAAYWQNDFVLHFLAVTLLTYFLLLAVALIGTYIPVHRAARILPADALRDE